MKLATGAYPRVELKNPGHNIVKRFTVVIYSFLQKASVCPC
jgi:hypothetical protein